MEDDLEEMLNGLNNFQFIAQMTTCYYIELNSDSRPYKRSFRKEKDIFLTAAALDAQFYLFVEKTLTIEDFLENFKNLSEDCSLLDVILQLEILIFSIDTPEMDKSEIVDAVNSMEGAIKDTIDGTVELGIVPDTVKVSVKAFMIEDDFKSVRETLGIKEVGRFWKFLEEHSR